MREPMPYLERVKIQAEILIPLFRRLRAELGDERACALVRAAVAEFATGLGQRLREGDGTPLTRLKRMVPAFTAGNALDIEPLTDDARELRFNVRGCRYAEYFQSIGEPLLGAMLTCEMDPPMTDGIGDGLRLERTQTLLKGGTHCDFRWSVPD
ncbi:MAG: L-2-amino-thiazoline-4-carboxylic acid hydrolase [Gammaproteobacteria bacterium]